MEKVEKSPPHPFLPFAYAGSGTVAAVYIGGNEVKGDGLLQGTPALAAVFLVVLGILAAEC